MGNKPSFQNKYSEPYEFSWERDQEKREPINFLCSNLDFLPKEPLETHVQIQELQHQLDGKTLYLPNALDELFVYNYCCEHFKCEELWFTYCVCS